MRAYVTECSSVRSSGDPASASRSGTALRSPMRPSASAAARWTARHAGFQRVEQLRQRRRITPDSRRNEAPPVARSGHDRSSANRTASRAVGRLDARERPHGVAPRRPRREGATADVLNTSIERGDRAAPQRRELLNGSTRHGRPDIVEQSRQAREAASCARRVCGRAGRHGAARPCGGRGRSRRARPAWRAARWDNRACTTRRCRRTSRLPSASSSTSVG